MKGATAGLIRRLEADAPVKAIQELSRRACERDLEALDALVRYSRDGKFIGMRGHVVATLAEVATASSAFLEGNFRGWLQPTREEQQPPVVIQGQQFWAVLGLLNVLGSASYPELTALASNGSLPTAVRAHAVKLLATHSGQSFDAGRPSDPGHWESKDIDVARLSSWASSGYPRGAGYVLPASDPSLDSPVTRLEVAASQLDRRLHKQRQERFDRSNPSNLLIRGSAEKMKAIKDRFNLPSTYLEFLERFSPLKTVLEGRKFVNGLQLYGVDDLASGQFGYAFNPVSNQPIEDWPTGMIVVANDGGDPYALDLSRASASDAPICRAEHGRGSWRFREVAPSFLAFIEQLK